tara:strand:+ start:246 stop:494 length:249 start_codon:yes stop_codon:yes gene_type:complete
MPHAPTFASVRGRVYTTATVRPIVMRRLRRWRCLPHLDTTAKRSLFASAWLGNPDAMRFMNGYTPGAVADAIEGHAIIQRWP